jgi:DNA-binding response OmpR family regulator
MNKERESAARVLIVDDEPMIVEFVSMGLRFEGYDVEAATDGRSALETAGRWQPDLVILDVMLPELDGLEVCRRVRSQSDVPILMLTARGDVDDRVTGLESGADDYLSKPFQFKELLARTRALLRRRHPDVNRTLRYGDVTLNRDTREVERAGVPIDLALKEFELLELFLAHPRHVFSREVIMNRIWGYDYEGDSNVIDVHIRYLRVKLGDVDRTLIRTVRGVGYSLGG